VSREALLLFNNLLLVSLTLVVLWGVIYPIMTAAFTDTSISLEKPWYDFFAAAFGLPLVLLVAFAPVIAWQGTAVRRVLRSMMLPITASLVLGIVLIAFGLGSSPSGIAAASLGMLVIAGVIADFVRALRLRHVAVPEQSRGGRLLHVLRRNRRRWGAWTAHAGIALLVVAIAGSAWTVSSTAELRVGETATVGDYKLTYVDVSRDRSGARMRTRARFEVRRDDRRLADLYAGRDFHPASGEVSNEVGIRHDLPRMHDLFVTVDRLTEDGVVRLQLFINPLVPLLWIAGLLTALGAVIAALPDPRSKKNAEPSDTNGDRRVEPDPDAVHELRNGAATPGELLSGVRRTPLGPRL
ncbi:MAG: cytochrome c-type biogenesis CcmF C-terminal domain-containing protein, partial [Gaiellales bacterium]